MPALDERERLDWLQLIRTPNIGPITFHQLIARYGSAADALAELPDLSTKAGRARPLRAASRSAAEAELDAAFAGDTRVVAFCEDDYPASVKAIPDPPPLLFVRGTTALFEKPMVAIIGARNASGVGRKMARTLGGQISARPVLSSYRVSPAGLTAPPTPRRCRPALSPSSPAVLMSSTRRNTQTSLQRLPATAP